MINRDDKKKEKKSVWQAMFASFAKALNLPRSILLAWRKSHKTRNPIKCLDLKCSGSRFHNRELTVIGKNSSDTPLQHLRSETFRSRVFGFSLLDFGNHPRNSTEFKSPSANLFRPRVIDEIFSLTKIF